jgi:hypothetical protein
MAALGGAATVLLGGQAREAYAAVSGVGTSGQVAYWTDASGSLAGFPSQLNAGNNSVALGVGNSASGTISTVGGGSNNTAGASGATIGGGQGNSAFMGSTVAGGVGNIAYGTSATVGGGAGNSASGTISTVGGGFQNTAGNFAATVGGGTNNVAAGWGAVVGGGGYDNGPSPGNSAAGNASTVAGGVGNVVSGSYASIGGGRYNTVGGADATIGGGQGNLAGGDHATVAGGGSNAANGTIATIGGGLLNNANGSYGTVGGGYGNSAAGAYSTVPGGIGNVVSGANSFGAGSYAHVLGGHHGATLFSDDSFAASGVTFNSVAADEFAVRATGGFRFVTGVDLAGNVTNLVAVNASGSLGVRTGSPSYALDVQTSGSSSAQLHITPTGTDSGGYLTSANPGNLFMSAGAAWNGSAWVAKNSTAYQYGGGTAGVRFFFDTGLTVGSTYTPTTRMFIGPTGNVGIGMSTQPGHLLQLGLDDAAKPSTNTWTIASDGRLKEPESIEPFTEGSEFIKRLPQPVWFRYRKDSGLPSDRRVAGWVAQDIAPIAPFMIRRTKQKLHETDLDETETLSLNTNELPYALVNSTKEVLELLEEMLTEIFELKARLAELEKNAQDT